MMYFSQLVSTMRNPTIAVAVVEDGGAIQYTGDLFDLPFCPVFVSGTTSK